MIPLLLFLATTPPLTVSLTQSGPVRVGAPVPWFAGWTVDDRVLNRTRVLAGLAPETRGVVIVVFATWCAPCRAGLEEIGRARARLRRAGMEILLVDYREAAEVVEPWLAARGLAADTPTLLDPFGRASAALGAASGTRATLPRTVVIDREGVVRGIFGAEGVDYLDQIIACVAPRHKTRPPLPVP